MKIIVTDYDRTLKTGEFIEKQVIQAIIDFRNQGNLFVIATGRSYASIYNDLKDQGLQMLVDYIISSNGAMITDINQTILYEKYLEPEVAYSLIEYAEKYFDFFTCSNGYNVYGKFNLETDEAKMHQKRHEKIFISKEEILKTPIISLNVRAQNNEKLDRQQKALMQVFEKQVACFKNLTIFDVMPKGISKANGVSRLLNTISYDEIHVIGDDFNDLDMVKTFHGYSMSHGVEALKEVALKCYDCVYDLIIEHTK